MSKERPAVEDQVLIALYDYNPLKDELPASYHHHQKTAPDSAVQLRICRGDKLVALREPIDWWLLCRSVKTKEEGYICSVLLAPLLNEAKYVELSRKEKKRNRTLFPDDPKGHQQKSCPREKANIFSILTFWWLNSIITTGYKRPLGDDDIWKIEAQNKSQQINELVEKEWHKELEKMKRSPMVTKIVKQTEENFEEEKDPLMEKTFSAEGSNKPDGEVLVHSYQPSLTKVFLKVFGLYFFIGNIQKLIHDVLLLAGPYMLK